MNKKNLTKEEYILEYLEHLDKKIEQIHIQLEIINEYLYNLTIPQIENDISFDENLIPIGSTGIIGEGGSTK